MKKRFAGLCLCAALLLMLLGGCAAGSARYDSEYKNMDIAPSDDMVKEEANGSLSADLTDSAADATRKIIRRVEMEVQTKTYDALLDALEDALSQNDGYIESSRESGTDSRYAHIVVRVPAENLNSFTGSVETAGTVISSQVATEEVTLEYIDIESRIKALRAEQTSLLAMLEKAETLNDLLTIQSRVTEVTAELESYESRLRALDSLVSYSTVTLRIYEVERVEQVEELTAWQEIGRNLQNNCEDIADGFVALFVWFVSALPYLLLVAVPVLIVVLIVLYSVRKSRKKSVPPYGTSYDPPKGE